MPTIIEILNSKFQKTVCTYSYHQNILCVCGCRMVDTCMQMCAALRKAVYDAFAAESPTLTVFVKRCKSLPGSGFLSRHDMT